MKNRSALSFCRRALFAACLSLCVTPLRADSSLPDYGECLDGFAGALVKPLADAQAQVGKHRLAVAIAGIREQGSGQRSLLCQKIEADLSAKLKTWTVMPVRSTTKTAQVLGTLDGQATDVTAPGTLLKLGKLLKADLIVSGSYQLSGSAVLLKLRLLRCSDAQELWSESSAFPSSEVLPSDSDLIPDTRPLSFVVPVQASIPVADSATAGTALSGTAASPLSPSAAVDHPVAVTSSLPSRSRWSHQSMLDNAEFSWSRVSLGAGYKVFYPQNPTFASVVGDHLSGAYIEGDWADVFNAELDFWSQPHSPLADISSLFAYGLSISANAPWRIGPHNIVYGGIGTRLESINVSSPLIPSSDNISFGNNSFFGDLGYKFHYGPYGLDSTLTYDFYAIDSRYITAKIGAYYEFDLE